MRERLPGAEHRLLRGYGVPAQESVFLIALSPSRWAELERRLRALLDPAADQVQVWPLCPLCAPRTHVICGATRTPPPPVVVQ